MTFKTLIGEFKKLFLSYTFKHLLYVFGGNFIVVVCGFLFTVIVARNLSPDNYGIYSTLTSLVIILSSLGELGIGGGLSSFLPPLIKKQDEKTANQVIKTSFLFQIFIALIITLALIVFNKNILEIIFHSNFFLFNKIIYLSIIGVFSLMLYNFISAVLSAKEMFDKTFIILSFSSLPRLILLVIISIFLKPNIESLFFIFIFGPIIASMIGLFFTSLKFLFTKGLYPLKRILKFSSFLAVNKLFVTLFSRLDVVMLASLARSYDAGIYAAASRVALVYPLIGTSMSIVMAPKYSKLSLNQAIAFTRKALFLILCLIISLIILIFLSPLIIQLVYGSSYTDASSVLQLLFLALIPFLIAIPFNNLLTYFFKKPQILAVSSLIQLFLIFGLNFILIPKLGSIAPAISIGISSTTAMIISLVYFLFLMKKQ